MTGDGMNECFLGFEEPFTHHCLPISFVIFSWGEESRREQQERQLGGPA
jgi:hypothetical protein